MSNGWIVAACTLAVLLAWGGLWRGRAQRRAAVTWTLLALQPLLAISLYAMLYPPARTTAVGTLQVIASGAPRDRAWGSAGSRATQARASDSTAQRASAHERPADPPDPALAGVVALPEADAPLAITVPDLATALRRQPAARVVVTGAYLPARDRDALAGRALDFRPSDAPAGLVEVWLPTPVAAGATFAVGGRVQGLPGSRIELTDPAGTRLQQVVPDAAGRFQLHAQAGPPGDALFSLRLIDAAGHEQGRTPVPVSALAAPPLKLLVLAGAPQPEVKYLRRWAIDAGLSLRTRIATGAGLGLGDAPARLDAATLDGVDLVVLDERSLSALPQGERQALGAAMQRGLGVLVRLAGAPDAATRSALREWGLPLHGDASGTAEVTAPAADADAAAVPALTRRALTPVDAAAAQVLARDAAGVAYAWWQPLGRGRVGLSTLTDSYLWALAGQHDRHAALWSGLLSPLARPRGAPPPTVIGPAWAGQRVTLCGVAADASVTAANQARTPLRIDPASQPNACAGYWPEQAGWHVLDSAGGTMRFYVQDPAQAHAWFVQSQRDATLALAGEGDAAPGPAAASAAIRTPGPRWPWWLAFVCFAAASWWLERRRRV